MRLFNLIPGSVSGLLPFGMFDGQATRAREEALRARRLETLYHVGQEKIWDGRKVLEELRAKHGKIEIADPRKRDAIARVFSIIMWGELAAWKVSTQLADQIVPLEAKMAATGQAHDEARHFYVMHDYLGLLGVPTPPLEFWSRRVVELTLGTTDLACKLAGMQLQVEVIALTIFNRVRELQVEPVLSELLLYYERDEARHVGLGVQYLPELLRKMSSLEHARFTAFQLEMLLASVMGLRRIEPALNALGIDARELVAFGAQKQLAFLNDLARESGIPAMQAWAGKVFDLAVEAAFPGRPVTRGFGLQGAIDRTRCVVDVLIGRAEGIGAPLRNAMAAKGLAPKRPVPLAV